MRILDITQRLAANRPSYMFNTSKQLIKYGIVACVGLGLHFAILLSLTELAGLHYSLSSLTALPVTFFTKFTLDKYWTFNG